MRTTFLHGSLGFRLEEQTRALILVLRSLDTDDMDLLRIYNTALENQRADPANKRAFYDALDVEQQAEDPDRPLDPGDIFDFDLFNDEREGASPGQSRLANFASRTKRKIRDDIDAERRST